MYCAARFQHSPLTWYNVGMETGTDQGVSELEQREKTAALIRNYQVAVVPGLLQTKSYAQVCIEAWGDQAHTTVAHRMQRQRVLEDPSKSCRFILGGAAVWNAIGREEGESLREHQVMQVQLKHLLNVSANYPHVSIQVLAFENTHPAAASSFLLVDNWAFLETPVGSITTAEPKSIEFLSEFFGILQEKALDALDSRILIEEALHNITSD
jgi:Domain of unknown function (DUF5753)